MYFSDISSSWFKFGWIGAYFSSHLPEITIWPNIGECGCQRMSRLIKCGKKPIKHLSSCVVSRLIMLEAETNDANVLLAEL